MLTRPRHLTRRQTEGRAFSEPVTLVRTSGAYVAGRWTENEPTTTELRCATAPMESGDARARSYTEAGVQLDALRLFWHADDVNPVSDTSAGDILDYQGTRYRVQGTQRWGGFSETVGQRIEGQ